MDALGHNMKMYGLIEYVYNTNNSNSYDCAECWTFLV